MAGPPKSPLTSIQSQNDSLGWVACTTDEILAVKSKLYDIVVQFPATDLVLDRRKRSPIIKSAADQKQIKATQRDFRRYKLLAQALRPLKEQEKESSTRWSGDYEDDIEPLLKRTPGHFDEDWNEDGDAVESTTWSELAYSSFIWWASAGEKNEDTLEEEKLDSALLGDVPELAEQMADERRYNDDGDSDAAPIPSPRAPEAHERQDARMSLAIISYFHRLTRNIFEVASDISMTDHVEADEDHVQRIDREQLRRMGLDVWSASDRDFVGFLFELWYQKRVYINPLGIECCGVKIC
jgi:hypothetical protein